MAATHGISVSSNFDSGNIDVVDASDPGKIELEIHRDPYTATDGREHLQWWHYRVTGAKDTPISMHITNAHEASYPEGWEGYRACCSYDRRHWFRVPTEYVDGVLSISHTPEFDAVFYAYFAPYTYNDHMDLVAQLQCHRDCTLHMLGATLDGHDLDLLRLGEPAPGKPNVWITARAHPGETMAEFFAEGLLHRLTDPFDPMAKAALDQAVFWVVPNMNPDGSWRGHLRTNAAGANLNREWAEPSMANSPEVKLVRDRMDEVGVDMHIDIHGDETLPYCFISGMEGVPRWGPRLEGLQRRLCDALKRCTPNFQTEHGYPPDEPGAANLGVCANQVAQRFDCLAVTLEMPFKDIEHNRNDATGWSPDRSRRLGAAAVEAITEVVPFLRE